MIQQSLKIIVIKNIIYKLILITKTKLNILIR